MACKYKIVVPSYKRPGLICRSLAPTLPCDTIHVVVFDYEVDEYRRNLDSQGFEHVHVEGIPPTLIGLVPKMQWIWENLFTDDLDFVFRFDDDVASVFWALWEKEVYLSPEEVLMAIEETYYLSKQFGAHAFGFQHLNKIKFARRQNPLKIHDTLAGACMGYVDRERDFTNVNWHQEDSDYALMCLFRDGVIMKNCMYGFKTLGGMGNTPGGWTEHRSKEMINRYNDELILKYGKFAHDKIIKPNGVFAD